MNRMPKLPQTPQRHAALLDGLNTSHRYLFMVDGERRICWVSNDLDRLCGGAAERIGRPLEHWLASEEPLDTVWRRLFDRRRLDTASPQGLGQSRCQRASIARDQQASLPVHAALGKAAGRFLEGIQDEAPEFASLLGVRWRRWTYGNVALAGLVSSRYSSTAATDSADSVKPPC